VAGTRTQIFICARMRTLYTVAILHVREGLWGDESEFENIRGFVSENKGNVDEVIQRYDCLVDRTSVENGWSEHDCHMFVAYANDNELLVTVHFFSQSAGPQFPTFVARLGPRPPVIPAGWLRGHIADYAPNVPGHAGELRELARETFG
jgi:hypothetical protein